VRSQALAPWEERLLVAQRPIELKVGLMEPCGLEASTSESSEIRGPQMPPAPFSPRACLQPVFWLLEELTYVKGLLLCEELVPQAKVPV
jgi:hypothetical protein